MTRVGSSERRVVSGGKRSPTTRQMLAVGMRDPDRWVCRIEYEDRLGKLTCRVISPIHWSADRRNVLVLCISRSAAAGAGVVVAITVVAGRGVCCRDNTRCCGVSSCVAVTHDDGGLTSPIASHRVQPSCDVLGRSQANSCAMYTR